MTLIVWYGLFSINKNNVIICKHFPSMAVLQKLYHMYRLTNKTTNTGNPRWPLMQVKNEKLKKYWQENEILRGNADFEAIVVDIFEKWDDPEGGMVCRNNGRHGTPDSIRHNRQNRKNTCILCRTTPRIWRHSWSRCRILSDANNKRKAAMASPRNWTMWVLMSATEKLHIAQRKAF